MEAEWTPDESKTPLEEGVRTAKQAESAPDDSDPFQARLQRVSEYQAHVLAKEDPLQANLGSINSSLMRMSVRLDECIERALASGPATLESIQKVLPSIDTHLRVTRQIDRLAQIELKAESPRQPADDRTR